MSQSTKIDIYSEDAQVINDLASALSVSSKEAMYLIIKFYQLKESSDIQSIKWKLIQRLEKGNMNWSYLLALRFLYITIGEILKQTNFHVRT